MVSLAASKSAGGSEAESRPRVGGWLLLPCWLLILFHPLSLAVTAAGVLPALAIRGRWRSR